MSGGKGNLASRSLEYRAPEVPNFLKALKAQVSASERYASSSKRPVDELDSLVSSASSAEKRKARDDDEYADLDSDDEIHGAQVVVLKDGKHLSHQEALQAKAGLAQQRLPSTDSAQTIASSGGNSTVLKRRRQAITDGNAPESEPLTSAIESQKPPGDARRGESSLDHVKDLIRSEREARSPSDSVASKGAKRKAKNAEARKLKAKSGKGLSFDLDAD